jgi:hypothetical protein
MDHDERRQFPKLGRVTSVKSRVDEEGFVLKVAP